MLILCLKCSRASFKSSSYSESRAWDEVERNLLGHTAQQLRLDAHETPQMCFNYLNVF